MPELSRTRNFCIIAHIDHGKSTLADRMLQLTNTIDPRHFRDQVLDDMDLERERGITIKSHPVTMLYTAKDGVEYTFNLIDTPGHMDFAYEVSRSMAACEGAILVIDAAQGVEAQTVANAYLAIERGMEIIPVLNKIDLPSANIEEVMHQVEEILAISMDESICVSAKTGKGIEEMMETIISRIPPPPSKGKEKQKTRALIFDSKYDTYRGVITDIRIVDGQLSTGESIRFMRTGKTTEIKEVGIFCPAPKKTEVLEEGQVGYIIGTIKNPKEISIGDTITTSFDPAQEPLAGFAEIKPMVFCGLYPVDTSEYEKFRQSLDKLSLNDSSFTYHPENSAALGFGFWCGFLGLLHMEIIHERLHREFNINLVSTHPGVVFKVYMKNGRMIDVDNPVLLPDPILIDYIEEPMIHASIISLNEHIGDILKLVMERRGKLIKTDSLDTRRVMLICSMPFHEILIDFHDSLKSVSKGYASMNYEKSGYAPSNIVKLEILLNSEPVDAFSSLVHESRAVYRGRQICKSLKDAIPPHQFVIPVQAVLNKKIIARETIRAYRKDVTAKLYGGDVTRKNKLLDKQKAGKRRMKQFGRVNVPQKAFLSVLKSS